FPPPRPPRSSPIPSSAASAVYHPPAGRWAAAGVSARRAERLIDVAGRAVPGLRDRLLWHEVRGPADVAAATGAADGAIPAPALAGAGGRLLHAANSTGTDGLFTVGGWSHPGGGLPHAGMSGALVAGLVVEGPEFRGSQ
ncbi:NAD(P)/FAD-dependent oxidoreductase, partial [Streptomyces olivaceus]